MDFSELEGFIVEAKRQTYVGGGRKTDAGSASVLVDEFDARLFQGRSN